MPDDERPQIYLITPPAFEVARFADVLQSVLDAAPVACLRLALAGKDEGAITRAADTLREIAHARDVPLVIAEHAAMVAPLGLDGVHLERGARGIPALRKRLGADAIIGADCGNSRHDGISAAEAGCDYIAFGPCAPSPLGDGSHAPRDLFAWWSEMIEVPVVAEGRLDAARIRDLAPVADFFAIGEEIWRTDDPAAALMELARAIGD